MKLTIDDLSIRLLSNPRSNPGRLNKVKEEREKPKPDWTVRLIEQTAIYSQLKANVTSRLATIRVLSDTIGEQGDAEFEAMVHDFIRTSRQIGARTVLCTFATSHIRKDLPNFPDLTVTFIFRYNFYLSLEGWVNTIERFNRILRRIAREEGLILIDLEAVLAGHEEYFRDFVHFTPNGHAIVAEVMHDTLLANSSLLNRHHFLMP